jgi:class 3 adenylate cyclase
MALPSGTVTLLFTDVEGSTALAERLRSAWASVLEDHRRLVRETIGGAGGEEVDARGEESLSAFATARAAVEAALAIQRAHDRHPWPQGAELRVRIGIHTGEPALADTGYLGLDVHRGARICALAHGGQVLLSQTTRDLLGEEKVRELGDFELKGVTRPERIFQLVAPELAAEFPPQREALKPLAVEGREHELAKAVRRRLAGIRAALPRRRAAPGLAELGWDVRKSLPGVPSPAREELAALAGDLFAAGRSAGDADIFLAGVDRKLLLRRLAEHQELAVLSRRAEHEVEAIARRLAELDELLETRRKLDDVAVAVRAEPANPGQLRERVRDAGNRLDAALEARDDIRASGAHLQRTPWRGIYRHGNRYVVPLYDEVGIERVRRFERSADARAFRRAQRVQEKRQRSLQGAPHDLHPGGGSGGV